ncbi:hypothetical protein [Flagellimonas flava]|uniref:hypothetical protein n=1 Tax=Flagellimonas flava TaxID=570519 RepID=UPI003D660A64
MQILAIDKMKRAVSESELNQHLPEELAATVKLYLDEKIRSFYFRKDRPGVIFFMETASLDEARSILEQLPLVEEGILDFDLIPVGALTPLATLLN